MIFFCKHASGLFLSARLQSSNVVFHSTQALALLDGMKTTAILADRGYDIVDAANAMGAEAVIPPKAHRKAVRLFDKDLYKARNLIARMFNKIKYFRRVATRYDKTASAYLGFVWVAGICL